MRSAPRPRRKLGVHLRKDAERGIPRGWFPRDPVKLCRTPDEYLHLAARYESIVTDRLHFAICGLLLGRQVVCFPTVTTRTAACTKRGCAIWGACSLRNRGPPPNCWKHRVTMCRPLVS